MSEVKAIGSAVIWETVNKSILKYILMFLFAVVSFIMLVVVIENKSINDWMNRVSAIGVAIFGFVGLLYIAGRARGDEWLKCLILGTLLVGAVGASMLWITKSDWIATQGLNPDVLRYLTGGVAVFIFGIAVGSLFCNFGDMLFPRKKSDLEVGLNFASDVLDKVPETRVAGFLESIGSNIKKIVTGLTETKVVEAGVEDLADLAVMA